MKKHLSRRTTVSRGRRPILVCHSPSPGHMFGEYLRETVSKRAHPLNSPQALLTPPRRGPITLGLARVSAWTSSSARIRSHLAIPHVAPIRPAYFPRLPSREWRWESIRAAGNLLSEGYDVRDGNLDELHDAAAANTLDGTADD